MTYNLKNNLAAGFAALAAAAVFISASIAPAVNPVLANAGSMVI